MAECSGEEGLTQTPQLRFIGNQIIFQAKQQAEIRAVEEAAARKALERSASQAEEYIYSTILKMTRTAAKDTIPSKHPITTSDFFCAIEQYSKTASSPFNIDNKGRQGCVL